MTKLIKAIVKSNSSADNYARVKLSSEGIWVETGLICSVGGIPLKIGDSVYVDVSQGYEYPMIVGRSIDGTNQFEKDIEGALLFEASNGTEWTIAYVKDGKLHIANSSDTVIEVNGSSIKIEADLTQFNKGENGAVHIVGLTTKINELVTWCKTHKHGGIIKSVSGGSGAPAVGVTGASGGPTSNPTNFNKNDYEDTKIKH